MSASKTARLVPQPVGPTPEEVVHISSFAIIRRDSKLLLAKRLRPEFTAGKWTIPSAVINYGEHPELAIKRIVKEQLGSDPSRVRLLDVQSHGDKHWDICFVYDIDIPKIGTLSQDVQHAEHFDIGKLPPELRDDHREVLQMLGNKLK